MKRILLIGNSHVGAVKQASERQGMIAKLEQRSIDLTFCATVGSTGLTMAENHVFVDRDHHQFKAFRMTSGAESIDLKEFDKVFLFGGETPLNARRFFSVDDDVHALSEGLVTEICRTIFMTPFSGSPFHDHLLRSSDRPIFCVPNPCEPELLHTRFKEGASIHPDFLRAYCMPGVLHAFEPGDTDRTKRLYELSLQVRQVSLGICHSLGYAGALLPPQKLLLADGFRTKDEYSRGSLHFMTRREEPHVDPHMNADYGEHMLDAILEMS